jgi:hypothetical protein
MIPNPCRISTAPNRPCATREAISASGLVASPHSTDDERAEPDQEHPATAVEVAEAAAGDQTDCEGEGCEQLERMRTCVLFMSCRSAEMLIGAL